MTLNGKPADHADRSTAGRVGKCDRSENGVTGGPFSSHRNIAFLVLPELLEDARERPVCLGDAAAQRRHCCRTTAVVASH